MSLINGKNIFIMVRNETGTYYPIACDSSCTIRMQRGVLAVTGPDDGVWRKVIPTGVITATINGNGLINYEKHTSLFTLQKLMVEGTKVRIMCQIDDKGDNVVYESFAYVTSMEFTGAYRALGSFTYELAVDGEVSMNNSIEVDETEIGIQNLLLVSPGGAPLEIDNNENNLIL